MSSLELLSFRRLIDHVIELSKKHWRTLFLPAAVPLVAFSVFISLLQFRLLSSPEGSWAVAEGFLALVFIFFVLAGFLLIYNILLICCVEALAGRPASLTQGFKKVLRPAVLLNVIAVAIVSFASFLFCIFPAIWVIPWLTFVIPAMIEEGKNSEEAWKRSFELSRHNPTGRWRDSAHLRTLTLLVVGGLVHSAASFVVQWPFIIAQQVLIFREAAAGQADAAFLMAEVTWLQVPAQILGGFVTAAAWLYMAFGVALLFHELRRRKEGGDLELAIHKLTGFPESP